MNKPPVFSTRVLLAFQAVLFIAYHGRFGNPIKSQVMVERYGLTSRALEPILQTLTRAKILESKQGANGGYSVLKPAKTTLADIARLFLARPEKKDFAFQDIRHPLIEAAEEAQEALLASLARRTLADYIAEAEKKGIPSLEDAALLDFTI